MAQFRRQTKIKTNIERVFNSTFDPDVAKQIMDNLESFEKIDEGEVREGTRFRETRLIRGKPSTMELKITKFEFPDEITISNIYSGIKTDYAYKFKERGDEVEVELYATIKGTGFKRLIAPLVSKILQREDGNPLERLKQTLEKE